MIRPPHLLSKRGFLCSFGGAFTAASLAADTPPVEMSFEAWRKRTASALSGFQRDPDQLTGINIGDLGRCLDSRNPEIALPAIYTNVLRGWGPEHKWWTAGNTEGDVRIAIVALYELCSPEPEPKLGYFADNAERFAEKERGPRLAEIGLVKAHRASFAALFLEALAKNPSKNNTVAEFRDSLKRAAQR
jgi:hypothetical protein